MALEQVYKGTAEGLLSESPQLSQPQWKGHNSLMKQLALTKSSHISLSSYLLPPLVRELELGPYAVLSVAMNCSHLLLGRMTVLNTSLFIYLFFSVGVCKEISG